jgi:5-methylcytosine-specific restriction endonuclease McrA
MQPGTPIPKEVRRIVWERCHGRCEYCGKRAIDPHHIKYRSHGGDNNPNNLIALCRDCHENIKILIEIAKNPFKFIGRYKW